MTDERDSFCYDRRTALIRLLSMTFECFVIIIICIRGTGETLYKLTLASTSSSSVRLRLLYKECRHTTPVRE